jgi:cell division protein FtsN
MKKIAIPRSTPARVLGGGTMLGVFVGLVVGIVIAAGVVLYLNKATLPFQQNKGSDIEKPLHPAAQTPAGAAPTPQSLPGKPGDKPQDKRFTFYDILPGNQEAVPGAASSGASEQRAVQGQDGVPSVTGEVLFLQVGAFQKSTDADNLKARLALMGLVAGVQEVSIPEKGTLFRVRVGPYASVEEMNRARGVLAQNEIPVSVVKARDGSN